MTRSTSPWVAWPPGADPDELTLRLRAAHEQFMAGEVLVSHGAGGVRSHTTTVRRVVLDSWLRSRSNGIDPEQLHAQPDLAMADLQAYRRGHVLAPLMPIVRRLLIDGTGSEGMVVALADDAGRLLWVDGDRAVRRDIEEVGFAEGARWGEKEAGTNAPGMALATDHEVQIFTAEHFARAVQPWSCTAAPVHDPTTGRLIGVLDITGHAPAASPLMLSLVRATVAAMESALAIRSLESSAASASSARMTPHRPRALRRLEVLGTSVGTLEHAGGRQVLTLRHAELILLLRMHPAGLTGEQLATLLYDGTPSTVTVRAEMSRLRRAVGALLGESRPYRLSSTVRCDVDDVREALARGDVLAAVRAYRGPVLPRSEAPAVVALRDELAGELHEALLRTEDRRALEAWTLAGEGSEDWEAWQRLLHLLPEGTPGWIRARAHVDALERELAAPVGSLVTGRTAPGVGRRAT